jgi:nucleotide-binding universal stress UspA family protein
MEKSILILSDLSENATHATEVALVMAAQLDTNLVLLNCNNFISSVTYYPIVPVICESPTWYEDTKTSLTNIAEHLKHKYAVTFQGSNKVVITTMIKEGDLWGNVKDILRQHHIELIVMGGKSGSSTEHFLFGSDTLNIIEHSSVPVLVVPQSSKVRSLKRITFATSFIKQDINTLKYIVDLRQQLAAHLEIMHVKKHGPTKGSSNHELQQLISDACRTNPLFITYHEVYGKDPVSSLTHYCNNNDSDILVMSYQHRSLLYRAFKQDPVEKSLFGQTIPFLVIPELRSSGNNEPEVIKELHQYVF